ncbi:MAG: hypothetical protein Q8N18_01750 [Opitutaceae bacterium]|nr:hypothetical protein [Opitutaceae bacterium]
MKSLAPLLLLALALCGCGKKAPFHEEYAVLIREARTPTERLIHTLDYRLMCYAEKNELEQHLVLSNGVDQFEAWMLTKIFISEHVGACFDLEPPVMIRGKWTVRNRLGRALSEGPPILVDAISGQIACEGHPTIEDPIGFLTRYRLKLEAPKKLN